MNASWLGLPRLQGTGSFLLALVVSALGSGLYAPVSLLYFHLVAGLELPAVGLTLSAATVFALPVAPLAGALVDRYGARRVVGAAEVLQGLGFIGYLGVTRATGVLALFLAAVVVAVGQRLFWSSYFALVADISSASERDRWYALAGAVQSAGLGAGGLLVGLLVATSGTAGFSLAVAANGLSFLLSAALLLLRVSAPARVRADAAVSGGYRAVLVDRPFLWLIVTNVAFAVCSMLLTVGLPVYVTEALRAPGWMVGALFALNTALVAAAQTTIVRLLEPYRRTRALAFAGLLWAVWCGLLTAGLLVPGGLLVPYLFGVTGVYTLAELVHAPISNALASSASPESMRGRYLAGFQFSWSIAAIVTPTLFTVLYTTRPALPWLVVAGLALAASASLWYLEPALPPQAVRRVTGE